MRLYEISEQYQQLQHMAESDEETLIEAVSETMELVQADFTEKAQAIVLVAFNVTADIDAIDAQIKRLQDRKSAIQSKAEHLREYLKRNMAATGISNIKCPLFSITLSKPIAQVAIINEANIPDDYVTVKTTVSPDKKAILKALKDGKEVPGAALMDGTQRLIIK